MISGYAIIQMPELVIYLCKKTKAWKLRKSMGQFQPSSNLHHANQSKKEDGKQLHITKNSLSNKNHRTTDIQSMKMIEIESHLRKLFQEVDSFKSWRINHQHSIKS